MLKPNADEVVDGDDDDDGNVDNNESTLSQIFSSGKSVVSME